jgi:hypothetical protein
MPLSPHLRDRILRQLDTLNDDKGYAVLDYLDFVAAKYGQKDSSAANLFTRFTEGIEDTLRAGKVSASAIGQTMGLLNQAVGVLSGVAAAGKSVASDLVSTASEVASAVTGTAASGTAPNGTSATSTEAPTAPDGSAAPDEGANPSPS